MYEDYTKSEFDHIYEIIKSELMYGKSVSRDKKVAYIFGGQPGVGKSSIHSSEYFENYIKIDGDSFRKFHPHLDDFKKTDVDVYASRTQPFINEVVERLISDLSDDGYNIVIEGTLRTAETPVKTCNLLKSKGYQTNLLTITCDAEVSWNATLNRADCMKQLGEVPRLVPIDKYNDTVMSIPQNVDQIYNVKCFDRIIIIDRENNILYNNSGDSPKSVLESSLNLKKWRENYRKHEDDYIKKKIDLLKTELKNRDEKY